MEIEDKLNTRNGLLDELLVRYPITFSIVFFACLVGFKELISRIINHFELMDAHYEVGIIGPMMMSLTYSALRYFYLRNRPEKSNV